MWPISSKELWAKIKVVVPPWIHHLLKSFKPREKFMNGNDLTFPLYPYTGKELTLDEVCTPDKRNLKCDISISSVQSPFLNAENTLSSNVPFEIIERLKIARKLGTYAYFTWEFYAISALWSLTVMEMALKQKFIEVEQGKSYGLIRKNETINEVISYNIFELLSKGWKIENKRWFNGSFKSLFKWANDEKYIPNNIKIYLREVNYLFNGDFLCEIFPQEAKKRGILKVENSLIDDIQKLWNSLSENDKRKYQYTNSKILEWGIPKLRNMLVHPKDISIMFSQRTPIEAYFQSIEVLNHLWPK